MNLFKQKPTINFYPELSDSDVKVLKSREKNVVTLDIGPFRAKETILQSGNGSVYHSQQLSALTPHRCTYGYDVLVSVGRALFIHCRNEKQIIEDLGNKNVLISPRQIGFLGKKFGPGHKMGQSPPKPLVLICFSAVVAKPYFRVAIQTDRWVSFRRTVLLPWSHQTFSDNSCGSR